MNPPPNIIEIVEAGIRSFLESKDCPAEITRRVMQETSSREIREIRFYDANSIEDSTLLGYLIVIASGVATTCMEMGNLPEKRIKKTAGKLARIAYREMRPNISREVKHGVKLARKKASSLGVHVYRAEKALKVEDQR